MSTNTERFKSAGCNPTENPHK